MYCSVKRKEICRAYLEGGAEDAGRGNEKVTAASEDPAG